LENDGHDENVVAIEYFRKRTQILKRYQSTIDIFEHQYHANLKMLLSEYNVKCSAARMLRDGDLRALENNNDEPVWVGVT